MSRYNIYSPATSNGSYGAFYNTDKSKSSSNNINDQKQSTTNPVSSYNYSKEPYSNNNPQIISSNKFRNQEVKPQYAPSKSQNVKSNTYSSASDILTNIINSKVGWVNIGNTCYINSTLQILLHSWEFISVFLQQLVNSGSNITTASQFYDLLINIANLDEWSIFNPSNFIQSFTSLHPSLFGYSQNDTQEFCRIFLDDISSEWNRVKNPAPYQDQSSPLPQSKKQWYSSFWANSKKREQSLITDIFYGSLCYEFSCQCKRVDYNFSQFLDLPWQFDNALNYNSTDLNSMLKKNLLLSERIESNEKCKSCSSRIRNKTIKLVSLPCILILSLQRNKFDINVKNMCIVRFDEVIDLKNYVDTDFLAANATRYELFGITCHAGTIANGHYYAHVKIRGEWYLFNDSIITKAPPNLYSNEVYTLFYKKRN